MMQRVRQTTFPSLTDAFSAKSSHPFDRQLMNASIKSTILLAVAVFASGITCSFSQVKEFGWHDHGVTPYTASQVDPRFSYMLYIPNGYKENGTETCELLVLIHGTERRPDVFIENMRDFADKNRVILLAPLFPINTHGRQDLENYKLIEYKATRYDLILLSMVDETASKYRLAGSTFSMHGFSGGGHFVHRFFYLHPHRLRSISIGAPGLVTLIDNTADWWVGTRDLYRRFNVKMNLPAMRRVRVHMVVGAEDTEEWNEPITRDSEYWMGEGVKGADYNTTGKTRIERLATLKKNYEQHGIQVAMDIVPDAGHEDAKLFPAVRKFLEGELAK